MLAKKTSYKAAPKKIHVLRESIHSFLA